MENPINVLIVDDHPFIIEAYKNALNKYSLQGHEFIVTQANDCKSGYELIIDKNNNFKLAMFDVSMPEYAEKEIRSGMDLAKLMQNENPECKVMLLTMHVEMDRINTIIKEINPNSLLIKNDINFDELIFALDKTLKDEKYYSETIIKLLGQSKFNPLEFDAMDKRILELMAKEYDTILIARHLPLTAEVIEVRKKRIREVLELPDGTDEELVVEAKNKGILS
ncbi:response regulator [Flavobacterium capsici]|uniref:Response regulator n=1 Tax=Flavobacterium capsici TaxID=3075618 RepID=A0AA96J4U6_9FLAO|nr:MULTISPECIES: response regulator [unclassified Flavobacterium]WNM19564.1 response regulator [Flavobacterium sp. PMR2A8]WNM20953.1 response regulator [Flavobacterium sp. PMTSA4]